jgi:hypothetical protein
VRSSRVGSLIVPVRIPEYEIDVETHQATVSATYGLTSDLDVNATVPVVQASNRSRFRITLPLALPGACKIIPCTRVDRHSETGIGDVFLRTKLRLFQRPWGEGASGLVLRLPTGDAEGLTGAGTTQVTPMLYGAGRSFAAARFLLLRPYLNAGLAFDAEDVDRSEGRWGIGLDLGIAQSVTVGLGILGRHPFARTGPPGVFDVPRCRQFTDASCLLGQPAPIFGLGNDRPDFYDASVGVRVNLWRDVLIVFANALVPLNDAGLRSDVIPLVGVEGAF